MTISRRTLLKYGLRSIVFGFTAAQMGGLPAKAASQAKRIAGKSRILVVVQLSGGNDSLNMLVPYTNGHYYQLRPTIAVPQEKVLQLNQQVGLHPAMEEMLKLFRKGNLAVIQAVGYPKPSRSHFRSIEIFQSAEPDKVMETGWLGRYLDCAGLHEEKLIPAMNVSPMLPKTLFSAGTKVPTIAEFESFQYGEFSSQTMEILLKAGIDTSSGLLDKSLRACRSSTKYPSGNFGDSLRFISQMIIGGLDCTIYSACLEGFDTHTHQARQHGALLQQLSDGIAAFYEDLEEHHLENDVLLLTFSEFGRRAAENGGQGTDHGTAQAMFIAGGAVKGGIYGDHASMSDLDEDGDLKHEIDFRSIYGTILERWLGADSRLILGSQYGDDYRFLDV